MGAPRTVTTLFVLLAALWPQGEASADEGGATGSAPFAPLAPIASRFALDLSGVRYGLVRALETADKADRTGAQRQLVLATADVAPPLATLLDAFVQGKPLRRDVRLTSGAVMRKANDARLVSVRLPAMGGGGSPEIELALVAPRVSTQPLLTAKESPPAPASARITAFRVDVSGMQGFDAPKLDAVTLTQDADGTVKASELGFEVGAGAAAPFFAWQKAPRAASRVVRIEYVGQDGLAVLKLRLDRCTPTAVKPLGANGTTRVTLACVVLP